MPYLRIGLDFDNTIACYDDVFLRLARERGLVPAEWAGGKTDIREELKSRPGGEGDWQRLQGQVYGRLMYRAQLFPELGNLLLRLRCRESAVFIVSHKTEFGHNDPGKVPLRKEALQWLTHHGFFDPKRFGILADQVFFTETREEKVNKISELECDIFIDDLWEVFAEPSFPAETKRILFASEVRSPRELRIDFFSHSWREISSYLFGEAKDIELRQWVKSSLSVVPQSVTKLSGRANSKVYRVECKDQRYALKWYPDLAQDPRKRLYSEKQACEFLSTKNIGRTLQIVAASPELNLALFRWINGNLVTDVEDRDVNQALEFVQSLHAAGCSEMASPLPEASEACMSIETLLTQIAQKKARLLGARDTPTELHSFFEENFNPVYEEFLSRYVVEISRLRKFGRLAGSQQTLSPSDFGFHNSLRQSDGTLFWLDFEYFGWDDPVKLIADFLWHPGHTLSLPQRQIWLAGCFRIFREDEQLLTRFSCCFPLFGLRWSLIVLNVFCVEEQAGVRHRQLEKAQRYASRVSDFLKKPTDLWNELQTIR